MGNSVKKTCLIIQSGAMGDIFVVAPIAKYYHNKGYLVYWPVREKYFNLVSNYFPYVSALLIDKDKYPSLHSDWLRSDTMNLKKIIQHYDLVIDTSDRDALPQQLPNENFEQYKYRIANVNFAYKNHLDWARNIEKENSLALLIKEKFGININEDSYTLCHLSSSHGDRAKLPSEIYDKDSAIIEITEMEGFEIPDWYPVILHAKNIFVVESSVHQFIDGCINRLKYFNEYIGFYILSRSSLSHGESYTISKDWSKKYMK